MLTSSPMHSVVVSDLLDMARPGILDRVMIPQGNAEITNGMPILRCLSSLDDATTPDDVPETIMPRWAAWLCCTIADNLDEPDYIGFARDLADLLSGVTEEDPAWEGVMLAFVQKMVEAGAHLVAPLALKSPDFMAASKMATEAVSLAVRVPSRALDVLHTRLGIDLDDLGDAEFLRGIVFPSEGDEMGDIRSVIDAIHLPFRSAVYGVKLLTGDALMARLIALDYD